MGSGNTRYKLGIESHGGSLEAGPSPAGGLGGALAPPVFGQSVNPISTRGANYAHHSTTSPPGFSDLATGLGLDCEIN